MDYRLEFNTCITAQKAQQGRTHKQVSAYFSQSVRYVLCITVLMDLIYDFSHFTGKVVSYMYYICMPVRVHLNAFSMKLCFS